MPREISVGSVAMPLLESVDNPLAEPVMYAVIKDRDLTEAIINSQLNSMSMRIRGAMEYAKDYYTLGLPQGKHGNTTLVSDATLATIIATDLGITNGVVVDYNIVDTLNLELVILPLLEGTRGYNFSRNTISVYPVGMTVPEMATVSIYSVVQATNNYDVDIVYRIYRPEIADPYGEPEDPPLYAEYEAFFNETFTPIQALRLGRLYHLVKYYELDGLGEPIAGYNWWYYDATTGVYPELDPIKSNDPDNTFMPVIPIRYENITLNGPSHQSTQLNITSKQLMRRLAIGFDTVCDFVDTNPNLADIDHAFVMFGIDLQTTKNASIYYLAEFFDYLSALSYADQYDFISNLQQSNALATDTFDFSQGITPGNTSSNYNIDGVNVNTVNNPQEISLIEHGLDIKISYRYITTAIKNGVIGEVGTATKLMVSKFEYIQQDAWGNSTNDVSELILKVQITPNTYKEVVVVGLIHQNQIAGETHRTTIGDILTNVDNHNFIIPMHYGVSQRVPLFERTKLYEESFQLVINSYVVTELEWYETTEFQIFVIVVAVILTFWSAGSSILSAKAALASAGGVATVGVGSAIMIVLWSLVVNLVIPAILMDIIMEALVNLIGGELAIILSIVAAVVAIAVGDASSIRFLKYNIPTAQACLTASKSLLEATTEYYSEAIGEIQQELVQFQGESEKQQAELDKITELLDTRSLFDPLTLVQETRFSTVPDESPSSFYDRTIHNKNIGVVTLDVIGNYHEMLLQLPA